MPSLLALEPRAVGSAPAPLRLPRTPRQVIEENLRVWRELDVGDPPRESGVESVVERAVRVDGRPS